MRCAPTVRWSWPGLPLLLVAVVGCTGDIDGDPTPAGPQETPGDPPRAGGQPPAGAGTGGLAPAASGACNTVEPGPTFLRKLTAYEYDATVAALLGDQSRPGQKFPSGGSGLGFDNNAEVTSVSPLAVERYLEAASDLARRAVAADRLAAIAPCAAAGDDACARQFITDFGKKAWRRPLEAAEKEALFAVFTTGRATSFARGIELTLRVMLQSPQFLYRVEVGQAPVRGERFVRLTPWELASRLSYLIWGSMPDEALFRAAEAGQLSTPAQVAAQARRMLADPRVRAMSRRMHEQWLELDKTDGVTKSKTLFPSWDDAIAPLFREETELLIDHVLWAGGDGKLETLFNAPFSFMNARLAGYYRVRGPAGSAFEKVDLAGAQRIGLLTNGSVLASHSYPDQTSPIHRGVFVRFNLLCQEPPPPPPDVPIEPPRLDPKLTTRERFARHAADPTCAACHRLMDPIGLGMEAYDAAGLLRTTEAGRPIDTSGEVVGTSIGAFDGVMDLARKLAPSPELRRCAVRQWFRFGYGRGETEADACTLQRLEGVFARSGGSVRELLVGLTETDAFLYRRLPEGGAP